MRLARRLQDYLRLALAAAAGAAATAGSAADLRFEPIDSRTGLVEITLHGEIVPGDAERLEALIRQSVQNGRYVDVVNLYSPGGHALEGLALGLKIRQYRLIAFAPQIDGDRLVCWGSSANPEPYVPCECASACALAWLGGIERQGFPGFHRVYVNDPNADMETYAEMRAELSPVIRGYFDRVNAPTWLFDRMNRAGPHALVYLDDAELADLRWDYDYESVLEVGCRPHRMSDAEWEEYIALREEPYLLDEQRVRLQVLEQALALEQDCHDGFRRREMHRQQGALARQ